MMPSRGLRALRGRTSPLRLSQSRNLSSTTLTSRLTSAPRTAFSRPSPAWRLTSIPPAALASIRYASTSQTPIAPTDATPSSDSTNFDTITLDTINLDPDPTTLVPETVGYLHQLGIDFGWGPTSIVQWAMEGIHVYGGLPWWGAILTTSLVARLLLFPLFIKSSDSIARTAALGEVLKPYDDRLRAAQKENDTQGMMLAMKRKGEVKRQAGIISVPRQFAPMILQGVVAWCGIKLTRAMTALPVPGLHDGGFLWMKDLTLTDGYLLLPVLMAGTLHLVARMGGETGAATQLGPVVRPMMLWFMPGIVAIFMAFQPGAVCVWFCGSGIIGLAQGMLLQREAVRKYLGMAPNFKPRPGMEPKNTLAAMMDDKFPGLKAKSDALSGELPKKPAPYMNPTYQAPKVQRTPGRFVDTTLVSKSEEMIRPDARASPAPPKPSLRERLRAAATQTPEQKRAAEKAAFKKRAALYEQQAREKGRR